MGFYSQGRPGRHSGGGFLELATVWKVDCGDDKELEANQTPEGPHRVNQIVTCKAHLPSTPREAYLTPPSLSVLIFIITILLLSADFYYVKNIAGRRLVGLRWWNETDSSSGESTWVFESADESRQINATDSRFFWLSLYVQPVLWVGLALVAIVRLEFIW